MSTLERILPRIRITNTCWEWQGSHTLNGAGQIRIGTRADSKLLYVSRYLYELENGPIPEGMYLCHHCDNPPCVRPSHLFVGTPAENTRDMLHKGRGRRKLLPADVLEIRRRAFAGERQVDLAAKFGVRQGYISKVVSRQNWNHLP